MHIIGCGSKAIKSLEEDVGTAVNLELLLQAHILKSFLTLQSENIALVKKSTAAEGGTAGSIPFPYLWPRNRIAVEAF